MKTKKYRLCALFHVLCVLAIWCDVVQAEVFYVHDVFSMEIKKFDSSGQELASIPWGIADHLVCDNVGNLYVPDGDQTIYKINPSGQQSVFTVLPYHRYCQGLAFDGQYLYVANDDGDGGTNGQIDKFDLNGNKTTFATGLYESTDLTFDGSSYFYTVDSIWGENFSIRKIDLTGNMSTFATASVSDFVPWYIACDSSGNLYATDGVNQTIEKFDSNGNMTTFVSGLNNPLGLAFDSSDNLYVTTFTGMEGAGAVMKVDPGGNVTTFISGLDVPTTIAIYVPEPASMLLLTLGGLVLRCRRRM